MPSLSRFSPFAFATVIAVLGQAGVAASEEATVRAYSSWEAAGVFFQTGVNEATFSGSFSGAFNVEGDDGSVEIGLISCPGMLVVNKDDWSQRGTAACVITTSDAERIYADLECDGTYLEGCTGTFTFTGGTGAYSEISGGGPVEFLNVLPNRSATGGTLVTAEAVGLARWPSLTYRFP
jgi:hypothetical protein